MGDFGRRPAELDALDERTFDRFRSRLAAIEEDVPDPPPPAIDHRLGTTRLPTPRSDRRERQRHVYVLLVVALAALAVVLLPYVSSPRTSPLDQLAGPPPSTSPVVAGAQTQAPAGVVPTTTAAGVLEPTPIRRMCPLGPTLFEAPWFANESWAGADWAVIEGRLKASPEQRLMVWGTRGPFAGPTRSVTWPSGWAEQPSDAGLTLLDEDGRALARDGDLVMIGGSAAGNDGWHACGIRVLKVARTR